jgi:hypothetical protein
VRKLGGDRKQFNPVFNGARPQIVEREPFPAGTVGAVVAGVFVLALALAWLGVWRSQRGDRKFERQTLNRQFEVKPGESLNELGIEASGDPDFSDLSQHDTHVVDLRARDGLSVRDQGQRLELGARKPYGCVLERAAHHVCASWRRTKLVATRKLAQLDPALAVLRDQLREQLAHARGAHRDGARKLAIADRSLGHEDQRLEHALGLLGADLVF